MSDPYLLDQGLALAGKLFKICHQTPVTGITGGTSFSATAPALLIAQSAQNRRVTIKNLRLHQVGTVAGGTVHVAVLLDNTNRFDSNGTAIAPKSPAMDIAPTISSLTVLHGATASAASGDVRVVANASADENVGGPVIELPGPFSIGKTGSILIYWYAGTTAPTLAVDADLILEPLPA